jgi:glycosyltransferase involved in cell wall biosynthesis
MSASSPALSVVLPVRNARPFLRDALRSLQAQDFEDFEVLLQDDGSDDGSQHIASDEFARWDERFLLEIGPPRGVVAAANRAAARASSPLLVRMDADDVSTPDRLGQLHAFAQAHPDIGYFGSRIRYFPRENVGPGTAHYETWINALVTPEEIWRDRFVEYPLPHPSTAVRTALFQALGGYRPGFFPEDYDLFLRAAALGTRFGKIPEVLLEWREGAHRTTRHDGRYGLDQFRALKAEHLVPLLGATGRPVGIVGAGRDGKSWVKALRAQGHEPVCFLDVHPGRIGNEIQGLPVFAYDDLSRLRDHFFLSAVGQKGAREEVRAALLAAGLVEETDFLCVQ